jgi:MoaA/NifB/PqqE/SkfB family radical SAM enzyme
MVEATEQQIVSKKVKKAVWWITLTCNLKCPYCHAEQVGDPLLKHPMQPAARWVEAWNRIEGDLLIDITGGEPFLQPDFVGLVNGLDASKKIAMTTNLTQDITEFAQKVSPEKCFSITASLHPSSKMNIEYFIGKLLLLKNRGFSVGANYVAFPEQMWLIDHFKGMFEKMGLRLHIDPYTPGPVYPFCPTDSEKRFLQRHFGSDRDNPYDDEVKTYLCDAGMNYFVVSPNGQVSRCVSRMYSTDVKMGNIFDSDFHLSGRSVECKTKFCPGCDADKTVRVVRKAATS